MDSKTPLDRIDFEILDQMQKNARLSNKELAAAVNLAPSTCLGRVRRLQEIGALKGFHADVADVALGVGVRALIDVRLTQHSRDLVASFIDYAMGVPEVQALYHLTGPHDFLLHIAVRDMEHLRNLLMDSFTTRAEVSTLETHIVFSHRHRATQPNYRQSD